MTFLLTFFSGFLGTAMRGLRVAGRWLASLSVAQIALIVVASAGIILHIADLHRIHRAEKHDLATSRALGRETDAPKADIARWKAASTLASTMNKATVARVETQQATITKRTTDDYQTQLAALRARLDRVRAAPAVDHRPANGGAVSQAASRPANPADQAVPGAGFDLQYTAETELQLNALIDWVQAQAAVNPNAELAK